MTLADRLYWMKYEARYIWPREFWCWLAYRLPRPLVLWALVRIASGVLGGSEHPDSLNYSTMYRRFELGQGR